jgi:hypothetical protein
MKQYKLAFAASASGEEFKKREQTVRNLFEQPKKPAGRLTGKQLADALKAAKLLDRKGK